MAAKVMEREPVMAPDKDRKGIERIERLYGDQRQESGQARLILPTGEDVELPDSVFQLLRQVVRVLAQGEAVSIVPVQKELTTQQAADLLNVSRQYLVRLLDQGKIRYHRVGTHRRIAFGDLMEYKRLRDDEMKQGLDELTRLSQELGLYS
jgi:excisionase family DNA binding protein